MRDKDKDIVDEVWAASRGLATPIVEDLDHADDPEYDPRLGRVPGLYLRIWQYRRNRIVLTHLPRGQGLRSFPPHVIELGVSGTHEMVNDYFERGFQRNLWYPTQKDTTAVPGIEIDITARSALGFVAVEVEHRARHTRPEIRRRDSRIQRAGINDVFTFTHDPGVAAFDVPHFQVQVRAGEDIPYGMMDVIRGVNNYAPQKCSSDHFAKCPDPSRRNFCDRWHHSWTASVREYIAEEIPLKIGTGEFARLKVGPKQRTIITPSRFLDDYRAVHEGTYGVAAPLTPVALPAIIESDPWARCEGCGGSLRAFNLRCPTFGAHDC